ncbi:MAG: hypothetical protein A2Y07_06880 [Planctomycetes bacterium GWF2_50_10]|nr:MAG: hypothetical protein A2Y07_06880 [Planctomycetes bacterium GWF2_50_10]
MPEFILGMNAKLYHGDNDVLLATMTEISNVKDLTVTMEAGEADITTRGNQGWRATAPTLRECTVEFEMVWRSGDTAFEAIKTAFLTAGTICLAPLTDDKATAGTEGPRGNFSITGFTRNESLEEAITVSVTAKMAKFLAWEKIAA